METLYVLNIAAVRNVVKDCIDRPSTLSETMNQYYLNGDKPADIQILQGILDKLSRHEDDFKGQTSPKHLFNIVKDVTTCLREDLSDAEISKRTPFSGFFRTFDKRRLRTADTMTTHMYRVLERKTKVLRELITTHQKLIQAIQKAQQECWISKSKVNKYKLMLETARSSREHLKDELSKKGLNARDNAIKDLEKTLKIKVNKYDSATMTYCKLRCQVETTAHHMKQIDVDVRTMITLELLDRMEETLITLTNLSKAFLSQDRQKVLWEKVEAIDLRAIVNSVLSRGQTVYRYPDPCEYTRIHGFDKQIPLATYYRRVRRHATSSAKYHECPTSMSE